MNRGSGRNRQLTGRHNVKTERRSITTLDETNYETAHRLISHWMNNSSDTGHHWPHRRKTNVTVGPKD